MPRQKVHGPVPFGPAKPSIFALRGIRFAEGEDGANPTTTPEEPEVEKPAEQPAKPAQAETDWKAEARKWEARAKEYKPAAERLAEIEEAQKSEQQKLEDRAAKAEAEATAKAAELARYQAAINHKITDERELKLLTGKTPEELEEQAAAIAALRGEKGPAVPKPDPSVGPKEPTKPNGLAGAISAHYDAR